MRKYGSVFLAAMLLLSVTASVFAGGVQTVSGVTEEMCTPEYWTKAAGEDAGTVLMTADEIDAMNQLAVDASGTWVFDLASIREVTDADSQRKTLANNEIPTRELYVNGERIDNQAYFTKLNRAILTTGYTDTEHRNEYAICTSVADLKALPTLDVIGYSANDPDDEYQSSSLLVGEPFVIRQKCLVDGVLFYWGYADHLNGWVCADNLGICASKEEWLEAWQVDTNGKDFIVILQDRLTLEPSIRCPETSERKLTLGSVLKLVPEEDIPRNLGERNAWNNYVVYLPSRTENGAYKEEMALVSQNADISVGYPAFTQENLLKVAFSCLGDRYGWGNMLMSMDCSGYTRTVYRCFGLILPRNTNWQQKLPGTRIDLSGMTDAEKMACLKTLPAGTCLYFPGHTFLLLGVVNDTAYAISATGMLSEPDGEVDVQNTYSVIVNPLTVRRRSGSTWLSDMDAAVILCPCKQLSNCTVQAGKTADSAAVRVYDGETLLRRETDYAVSVTETAVTVIGMGNYLGAKRVSLPRFTDVPGWSDAYAAVEWAANKGIVSGVTATAFAPNASCTRAQAVTMLYRAAGSPESAAAASFTDVAPDAYYAKAVAWAHENGIVSGMTGATFDPDGLCTRGQMVTMLYRMQKAEAEADGAFADVARDAYYAPAVAWAFGKGITKGITETAFSPDGLCTRGQLAVMLYRLFGA